MSRNIFLVGLATVCVSIGVGLAAVDRVSPPQEVEVTVGAVGDVPSFIRVHVAGLVRSPGVVRVPEGSIVADAVEAAGGLLPEASTESLNLAAKIADGDQIFVAGPGTEGATTPEDGLVAVNRATASELESLPGVGPVLAERIVGYREENGPFREIEDLLDVPGIGESKLSSLRDLVRIP